MAYLTSFKSKYAVSTLVTFEAKTASRRIKFVFTVEPHVGIHSLLAHLSGLEGTLRGKDPDQRNF